MKKYLIKCSLVLIVLVLTGCTSESKKVKILKEKLDTEYINYELLNNCGYWNEGGDDELFSIAKINEKHVMISSYFSNEQIWGYDTYDLLNISLLDDIVVTETQFLKDSTRLIIIYNKNVYTYDSILSKIKDIVLRYGESKNDIDSFNVEVYYASSINDNTDLYKEFAVSQTITRNCDYSFYQEYKSKLSILNKFESHEFWIQTKKQHANTSLDYNQYINNEIENKLNDLK